MKKAVFGFLVISLLMIAGTITAAAETMPVRQNIGVVDINCVIAQSPRIEALQVQLRDRGKELSAQLAEDKANLSAEEYAARQQSAYEEFMKLKTELNGQVDQMLQQALAQVAAEKKLTTILYKNSIAYGGTDVTRDVINKL